MSKYNLESVGGLCPGTEPSDIISRYERIETYVASSSEEGAHHVAAQIAEIVRQKAVNMERCTLALASGNSTMGVYAELLRMHREEGLSFAGCDIFSIFEYYPMERNARQSYNFWLNECFVSQIDIPSSQVHYIDGSVPFDSAADYCRMYESLIRDKGGVDVLLLGIGIEGQIALNEGGTHQAARSRVVALSNASRKVVADSFYGFDNVPTRAITMGVDTILDARRVLLVSWGEDKAPIMRRTIEGGVDSSVVASYLQEHSSVEITLDRGASMELTRVRTPWLVGSCVWSDRFIRKAVLWLCRKVQKPILKLTYQDYVDNHLGQLIDSTGSSYDKINIKVFNDLQHTISGWPGGKPGVDDSTRPARSAPFPKRVVIFSPHPDDDVISMGGTFLRLVEQGHDVHVAYQTSGNIAVHDDVVQQIIDTARECGFEDRYSEVRGIIEGKKKGEPEPLELRTLKGAIRRAEARAACRHFGLDTSSNVHFLNLPFYETGSIEKSGVTSDDIGIVKRFLCEMQPDQIYAAGDLSDPHGTHRVCIEAVLGALNEIVQTDPEGWVKDCVMWLYRGAWQEWDLDMVDMAVPLSPSEVVRKRHAIYRHLSQKDIVPFPGDDKREFWQRAEDRTQNTAKLYDELGMAEYQAIEVFVRYSIL